ncbi:hypothetical protein TWF694_011725 [Orbilia ellipsospora]|uniref:Uncharacterized protein n=1 Tax=Orbilia ellipsospora TaxID=2528407 RepID=A0AAV9XCA3_9PEZI
MSMNVSEPLIIGSARPIRRTNSPVPVSKPCRNLTDSQYQAHMEYLTHRMVRLNTILKEVDDREEATRAQYDYYCSVQFTSLTQMQQAGFRRLFEERRLLDVKRVLAKYEHAAVHYHMMELGLGKIKQCDGVVHPQARCWEYTPTLFPGYAGMQIKINEWTLELWMDGETLE